MSGRRARLIWPLLYAVGLFAIDYLVRQSPELLAKAELPYKSVLRVIRFTAWLPIIIFIIRVIDMAVFDVVASKRRNVRAPVLLREIVSIVLFLILMAWALTAIFETKITAILAGGTILAAVLGLALQETLGNLFAGIALHLEDSFEIGDVIRSGEHVGVVEGVRWRGTRLRTFNNNIVILPNSALARDRLEVFPRNNLNARIVQVGIDANTAPAKVIEVLTQAAANVDGVALEIPCFARIATFAESAITYDIKYFTHDYSQRDRIDAEIRKAVWYALRRNGIPIAIPMRAWQSYEKPADVQRPTPEEILDVLSRVDVLTPLPSAAREAMAKAARVHRYSKGETILRRGDEGNSMFIVYQGPVSVRVQDEHGSQEVARLGAGEFFGEMALLTGERRRADVVAGADVVAVEITKDALERFLRDHPELADAISGKVMQRRETLDSIREPLHEETHRTVLSRIRTYFGLK
jgi:small-conductance mechanosensitive channel/CRP-like cAMP-binding protein